MTNIHYLTPADTRTETEIDRIIARHGLRRVLLRTAAKAFGLKRRKARPIAEHELPAYLRADLGLGDGAPRPDAVRHDIQTRLWHRW